jgi:hypothetical protein
MTRRGLKTRKGLPVSSQAFSTMLQNKLYVGIEEAPGYGVVGKRDVGKDQQSRLSGWWHLSADD